MAESDATILHQILLKLGSIEAGQLQLRADFDDEKDYSRESRRAVHEKLDGVGDRLGHVENTIQLAGQVTAQTRERIDMVKDEVTKKIDTIGKRLDEEISPPVEEFKRFRNLGLTAVGIVALGGTAFGAGLIWWGESTINAIRHILRIPG